MATCTLTFITFDDLVPGHPLPGQTDSTIVGRAFTTANAARPVALDIVEAFPPTDGKQPPGDSYFILAGALEADGQSFDPGDRVEVTFAVHATGGQTFYIVRIAGRNAGLTGPVLPRPGQDFTVRRLTDLRTSPALEEAGGLAAGTLIDTPDGPRAVETLGEGDRVMTGSGDVRALTAVIARPVSQPELLAYPGLRPLHLAAGTLGNARTLVVAPQQRLRMEGWRVELLFGRHAALVPAQALLNGRSVRRAPLDGPVTYYRLRLDGGGLVAGDGVGFDASAPGEAGLRPEQDGLEVLYPDIGEPAVSVARQAAAPAPLRPYQARHLRSH